MTVPPTHGAESNLTALLARAVQLEKIPEHDISSLTANRRLIIENISRYSRNANFWKIGDGHRKISGKWGTVGNMGDGHKKISNLT